MLLLPSCDGSVAYDKYAHTPISGWEKNDVLTFDIDSLSASGAYNRQLGLRVTGAYPFMKLTLIVETKCYSKGADLQEPTIKNDTVICRLINEKGVTTGQGISLYQYDYPIPAATYREGDSLHIEVRHDMKREILPGISDIGIKISKK